MDFSGLIHQAIIILEKGKFVSPWKHILVDEFQDISPQRAALLAALRKQNSQTSLYAVGDDWQAIYRFSGAQLSLTTAFNHYFGEGDNCALDTTYRFNSRIGEIANRFIQQNPHQLNKPLNSLSAGTKMPSRCWKTISLTTCLISSAATPPRSSGFWCLLAITILNPQRLLKRQPVGRS
ncbi:Helicase IV [Kluyvera cryocrescens]|uniref:Helicase IV n=1 Tax=Kluyvera cryocrescens TaxID=580 RepID=A0A485CW11_KLUCR|nr:Helicase IV [Kluyvera cryocrescens]